MSASNQSKIVRNKVLVTGASGLLGVAAIEKFLSADWEVVGVSRRKPELPSGRDIEFLSVDLRDKEAARAAFEPARIAKDDKATTAKLRRGGCMTKPR